MTLQSWRVLLLLAVSVQAFLPVPNGLRMSVDIFTLPSSSDEQQPKKQSRWESLNPKIKERIVKAGQERAIANKKKREPAQAKKRRTCDCRVCMLIYMDGSYPPTHPQAS